MLKVVLFVLLQIVYSGYSAIVDVFLSIFMLLQPGRIASCISVFFYSHILSKVIRVTICKAAKKTGVRKRII